LVKDSPKGVDISKALDLKKGKEPIRTGNRKLAAGGQEIRPTSNEPGSGWDRPWKSKPIEQQNALRETVPNCEEAKAFHGYKSAIKPAYEPIIMAMKPTDGTFADNALKYGKAGLNIDGCRISYQDNKDKGYPKVQRNLRGSPTGHIYRYDEGEGRNGEIFDPSSGRYPSNLLLSHSPRCKLKGSKSAGNGRKRDEMSETTHKCAAKRHQFNYGTEEIPKYECTEDCPVKALDEQSGEIKSGGRKADQKRNIPRLSQTGIYGKGIGCSELNVNGKAFKSDSGGASRFFKTFPHDAEFYYCPKASRKERGESNNHVSVKPLKLMEYLITLVSAPIPGLVLDPFAGSGSTLVACQKLGIAFLGIEQNEEYVKIARKRLSDDNGQS
jgi:hypothetical protein